MQFLEEKQIVHR